MGLILILGGDLHYSTILGLLHDKWSVPTRREHLKNAPFSSNLFYIHISLMRHPHAFAHTCVRDAQLPSTEP
jgi:hypothetical protein